MCWYIYYFWSNIITFYYLKLVEILNPCICQARCRNVLIIKYLFSTYVLYIVYINYSL